MSVLPKGSLLHFIQVGARLNILEIFLVYVIPVVVYFILPSNVQSFILWNATCQCILFTFVVQIPALISGGIMTYVDIGWPCGLVMISINAFIYGDGLSIRKYISCGLLFLHGGRMFFGAIMMFGELTKWTYRFKEDLPRYQFAKYRWIKIDGMSETSWWLKVQHDCGQQGFANCSLLALPTILSAFNQDPNLHKLEIIGWSFWVISYIYENIADIQKQLFLSDIKKAKRSGKQFENRPVLGMKPFNSSKYCLWTLSRHPNYFGELCCWFGVAIAASASVPFIIQTSYSESSSTTSHFFIQRLTPEICQMILYFTLFLMVRLFYDCLVWWTGAAPAEHFSSIKRKEYCEYQKSVPCLFPFPFPFIGSHMISGWPNEHHNDSSKDK